MSYGTHQKDIDHFYYDIVNTVYGCIKKCIPMKKRNEHSIVGWNEEVKHYHTIARSEFKFWKQNSKQLIFVISLKLRCPIVLLGRLVKLILPICGKITTVHY